MRRPTTRSLALAMTIVVASSLVAYVRCRDTVPTVDNTPLTGGRARLLELRRQLPGSIAGRVTAASSPVTTATVCARLVREHAQPHCVSTDPRGEYVIGALPPAAYVVWASAPGLGGDRWRGTPDGTLWVATDRRTTGIDLALVAGAVEVRGIVTDVRGRPIAAARVHVGIDARSPPTFTTSSAADGSFLAWAMPGDIHVAASADRHVDGEAIGTAPSAGLALRLLPESTVGGLVVEAGTRRPLEDARVEVGGRIARTDERGRFRIAKLSPGRYKPAATSIGGYGETAESMLVGLGQSVEDLVIEIHPVAVVAGRIVIDDGPTTRPCPTDRGEVWLTRYGSHAGHLARTMTDGDILLEGVVPGTYQVTAQCTGWLPQVPYPDLVVGNSDVEEVTWRVTPGARITGRVLARSGAPIAGAIVNHRSSGGSFGSATTAGDGTFTLEGVAPGKAELDAYGDGFLHADPVVVIAALDKVASAELVLDTGGSIAGEVVDEAGRPVVAIVKASGPGGGSGWSDTRGQFTIDALAPGRYELQAETDWGAPRRSAVASTQAIVTLGTVARVRVIAESTTGDITGTVVDQTGVPIGDAQVIAAREDEARSDEPAERARGAWHAPAALTALDGSFRLAGLPRGRFSVRAYRPGGAETTVEHVAIGERVSLTLRPTAVLAGVVVAAPGASIEDVTVSAIDRAREVSRDERLFHTGGRFALHDLPAGTYRLAVDSDPRSVITVTLAEGERRLDLRLVAQPRFTIRGRLVAADRTPLRGWTVESDRLERQETSSSGASLVVNSVETAVTGADGRFLIRNMPSGPATISAGDLTRHPDAKLSVIRELVLHDHTEIDLGDLVMVSR